jgi:hypothetical protein
MLKRVGNGAWAQKGSISSMYTVDFIGFLSGHFSLYSRLNHFL